jgi:hypothetical protein
MLMCYHYHTTLGRSDSIAEVVSQAKTTVAQGFAKDHSVQWSEGAKADDPTSAADVDGILRVFDEATRETCGRYEHAHDR